MGHTFSHHLFHIVFSTKERIPLITRRIEDDLYSYTCGIARNVGAEILTIGGDRDHIHILAKLRPSDTVAGFVRAIKSNTSRWLRESSTRLSLFAWQAGYSSFSVSESARSAVVAYIKNQKDHHTRCSFGDELRKLLRRHRVEFDPRHLRD